MKLPLITLTANELYNEKCDYLDHTPINVIVDFADSFRAVAEPLDLEEEIAEKYCLSEHLLSIVRKLTVGISMYDAGYEKKAVYEWTTMFALNLGAHITDTIRALHSFRTEYGIAEWINKLSGK